MNAVASVERHEQPVDFRRRLIPESLTPQWPELKRQVLALTADACYRRSIYSREVTPRSFALFDQWPEFRVLERAMPGNRYLGGLVA